MLQGPSWAHPCGTDALGQDLLARLMYGGKISLAVGVAAMFVAVFVGMLVGAVSGMASGRLDAALMWVTDMFLSLPQLPLLLLLIYLFRPALQAVLGEQGGIFVLIVVVIGGLRWMPLARLVRAQFLSLREKEFVEAARALGASRLRLVVRHIMPNALGPVDRRGHHRGGQRHHRGIDAVVPGRRFSARTCRAGGACCTTAQDYLQIAPHWALFPGLAIFLAVLSINFIGDGLRDALDPRRVI